jgi:hypothetical protein
LSRWSSGLVARYGPRTPLIIGPLIAAVGFLLFAIPSIKANYWTSLFPAFIVLGLGMAVSVAPLTTVVMTSVDQSRVGTASGINNAVARVAGVLAIAVLGIVMVMAFSRALQQSLDGLILAPNIVQEIKSNAAKLGGIGMPPNLDLATATMIREAIARSFICGFRIIMVICAAFAVGSAGIAWRIIPPRSAERVSNFGEIVGPNYDQCTR